MKKIYFYLCALALAYPSVARADAFSDALGKLNTFSGGSGINPERKIPDLIGGIVNTSVGVLGVVAVFLIVYAGGVWLTAAGNEEKVSSAKKIIRTTVIGIVIVGLAYGITSFVLNLVLKKGGS